MSLDVWLMLPGAEGQAGSGIFVREDGQTKEISRAEWDARFPGREPIVVRTEDEGAGEIYHGNITHNLNTMADQVGIYRCLWRPDEIGITKAEQLIGPLRDGLALLQTEPDRFKAFSPLNGWGTYEGLVEFVASYLAACQRYPQAEVKVWR